MKRTEQLPMQVNNHVSSAKKSSGKVAAMYACFVLAYFVASLSAFQAQAASPEAKVKTAYIYNILRNTTWPPEAFANDQAPYTVLILGEDKLEGLLDKVASSKKVNKRSIVVKKISSINEFTPCHILYAVGAQTPDTSKAILEKTASSSTLVLGETADFAKQGADVNFFEDANGTTGYEMNLKVSAKKSLKFDAQLRDLAKIVDQ